MNVAQGDEFRKRVSAACGLPVDQIIFFCSHSHSSPFIEPLNLPHPYFDFVCEKAVLAVADAMEACKPARIGFGTAHASGASFNTNLPLDNGRVKMSRDYREGLSSNKPIDPRLSLIRVDDEDGKPIAGFVRFAAHPACVIFNAPISGEYPAYLTERMSEAFGGAPILFGYGASGDLNCIPMFGTEEDSRDLGNRLGDTAIPEFEAIKTRKPDRFIVGYRSFDLPLAPPPPVEVLEAEIAEIDKFCADLDENPDLEWVIGINVMKEWPVDKKRQHVAPMREWAVRMIANHANCVELPKSWPAEVAVVIVDDWGLVFYPGEPFVKLSLDLTERSCLNETLMMGFGNGALGYISSRDDCERGGYQSRTSARYIEDGSNKRSLPFAHGGGEYLVDRCVEFVADLCGEK